MNDKRLLLPVLILSLIFCIPMYALAASDSNTGPATLRLEYDNRTAAPGDGVSVHVVADHAADLYGVQFQVKYDPSRLELKSASTQGKYKDFGGMRINKTDGTVFLPLLREGASTTDTPTVAKLDFIALRTGNANIGIQEIKAVTSETYINANNYKDLRELAVAAGGALTISIANAATPTPSATPSSPSTPSPSPSPSPNAQQEVRPSLQDLEKKLNADNPLQALDQLFALLSGVSGDYSPAEIKQLEKVTGELQQKLKTSVKTTVDSTAGSMQFDQDSLTKVVEAWKKLSELAASKQWNMPADKGIHIQLADQGASALLISPEQAKLLETNNVKLVLENEQGIAMISPAAFSNGKQTKLQVTAAGAQAEQQADKQLKIVSGLNLRISTMENGEAVAANIPPGQVQLKLAYDASSPQAHKLGVYVWNESAVSWEYVRKAKQKEGQFELAAGKPGVYAVMEFSANYKDTDHVYAEAQHAIEALSAKHYMNGTGEKAFSPAQEMTRAEFVALLVRILELDSAASNASYFQDIDADAWYAGEVNAARKAGIVEGDGVNFHPEGKLTREEMAVMMVKSGLLKVAASPADKFADDDSISDWAKDAIYAARAGGLINGIGNNTLLPKANASRADVAVMLLRLIEQR